MASGWRGALVAGRCLWVTLLGLGALAPCVWAEFVEPPPSYSLRSMAESPTRLPCRFRVQEEQLVQVSWTKEHPDGNKEQIITAHRTEGHTEFGRFSGRVHFESSDPMENSALIIRSTEVSDEGRYTCHISTFPSGNFDTQLSLTVWTMPISSLEPVEVVEGQSFRVAATCRSVARPPPRLSWETELPGVAQNRSSEGGAVSTHFSLHPLRSMNGKRLDCLVWHPSMETPRRLSNQLVVHYPPDAAVRGYDGNWFVGLEGASLRCDSGGNPKPQSFTWTRRDGALPEGVAEEGGVLLFRRPLSLMDAGVYECVAKNSVGVGKAAVEITVSDTPPHVPFTSLMIIFGAVAGALVVVMVISIVIVHCYHQRRNRKLEMELSVKAEEMSTLSRQASIRRMNSINTDPRIQMEENLPLRLESSMRTSLSSLRGPQGKRGSTLSMARAGQDIQERAGPLYSSYRCRDRGMEREMEREGERAESRQSVEMYMRNSNIMQNPGLPPVWDTAGAGPGERGREDQDEGDEADSSYISEALSNHFYPSNGVLRPKPHSNAILIHPRGQIV
ncbi:nectin-4-like [Megalops cyprinoides]|uniref:nectin-4-like n=1 Tax=Megalops cyprinoides TaxID=118141 RepID=UPI0018640527|nr:nectin-4-like [Megalops cyprinoides]